MKLTYLVWVILPFFAHSYGKEEGIKSKNSAEESRKRCPYSLKKLWHVEVSSFPFSAPPLVTDIDGDGGLDIVAAPFGETITVIEGENGKPLSATNWPHQNLDKSVYSSPLQFDIDGDGVLDILIVTSSGEGIFYSNTGVSLHNFSFELPSAHVNANWYKEKLFADFSTVSQFVSDVVMADYIPVDPHVLSSPVLYQMRYLILPVSYYYSMEDYTDPHKMKPWGEGGNKDKFYVSAVTVLDLLEFRSGLQKKAAPETISAYLKTYFLELHQVPTFGLFTPTVCNLGGKFSDPEIVHGTTSGSLYVIEMMTGHLRRGFPQNFGSISGRVSAADVDGDGILELYVLNTSGTMARVDSTNGKVQWTAEIDGSSFEGSNVADVDGDGHLDIVVSTNEGDVYALHGINGSVIQNYPYKASSAISGRVVMTKLNRRQGPLDMVFLSDDGLLHIVSSDQSCVTNVLLDDRSLVDIVSHDLVLMNQGMEFLVVTSDGSLICLGSGVETQFHELIENETRLKLRSFVYPRDPLAQNDFTISNQKTSVFIEDSARSLKEVTGNSFYLDFSVHNSPLKAKYNLRVYLGSEVVYQIEQIQFSSIPQWLKIQTPVEPCEAMVTLVLYDQHGFAYQDSIFLRFNQLILLDLQWLVVTPFIAMVIILLVNHGFPAKDLLPVTFPFKSK